MCKLHLRVVKGKLTYVLVVQFQHKYYGKLNCLRSRDVDIRSSVPLALLIGLVLPTLVGACWNDIVGSFIYAGLVTLVISRYFLNISYFSI